MSSQPASLSPAIALNRFGLGARPAEAPPADPLRWLTDQFARFDVRPTGFASLADAGPAVKQYREAQQANRRIVQAGTAQKGSAAAENELKAGRQDFREDVQALYRAGVQARADSALATEARSSSAWSISGRTTSASRPTIRA